MDSGQPAGGSSGGWEEELRPATLSSHSANSPSVFLVPGGPREREVGTHCEVHGQCVSESTPNRVEPAFLTHRATGVLHPLLMFSFCDLDGQRRERFECLFTHSFRGINRAPPCTKAVRHSADRLTALKQDYEESPGDKVCFE